MAAQAGIHARVAEKKKKKTKSDQRTARHVPPGSIEVWPSEVPAIANLPGAVPPGFSVRKASPRLPQHDLFRTYLKEGDRDNGNWWQRLRTKFERSATGPRSPNDSVTMAGIVTLASQILPPLSPPTLISEYRKSPAQLPNRRNPLSNHSRP